MDITRENEVSVPYEGFNLIYNVTNDYWYIEYLEENSDDLLTLNNLYDIIGFDINGHIFEEDELNEVKELVFKERDLV